MTPLEIGLVRGVLAVLAYAKANYTPSRSIPSA